MHPEDRVAVGPGARNDVQQDLAHRYDAAGDRAENGDAVMARLRTEKEIERDAEAGGEEARPLQDA